VNVDHRVLRRVLLGVFAIFTSYGLAAASAHVLYSLSGSRSEAELSALVRFILSPLIAAITGLLVGVFSTDRPVYLTIVGLAPWAITLLASATRLNARDLLTQSALAFFYVGLGGVFALLIWKVRCRHA
jgi:hypothetical protein